MSAVAQPQPISEDRMNAFLGKVVGDFGASLSSALVYLGQKLGLYKAMASAGPITPAELAERTSTNERYVREWLINQAAGGYAEYDAATGRYSLTPEQAVALTDEHSPFYVGGGFFVIKAMTGAVSRIEDHFRKGGGMLWGEHDPDLFIGTEKFFRPGYSAHLVSTWIPSLTGIEEKLKAGGKVADVGCGHGASTIIMAGAFPKSRFWGFDNHEASVHRARAAGAAAAVSDRVTFEVADARAILDEQYDLVCFFDCLHDMGDPVGAAKRASQVLADDGSALIVEPMAGNSIEENFNPIGRTFSAASTLCCTANSLALGGPALGAVATEEELRKTVTSGGFRQFRRATETPFNRTLKQGTDGNWFIPLATYCASGLTSLSQQYYKGIWRKPDKHFLVPRPSIASSELRPESVSRLTPELHGGPPLAETKGLLCLPESVGHRERNSRKRHSRHIEWQPS